MAKREEASVVLITLVFITVLMVLVATLATTMLSEMRMTASSEDQAKAFYLAEAGLEYGRYILNDDDKWGKEETDDKGDEYRKPKNNEWYDEIASGDSKIEIRKYEDRIRSIGHYGRGSSTLEISFLENWDENEWKDFFNSLEDISVASGGSIPKNYESGLEINANLKEDENLPEFDFTAFKAEAKELDKYFNVYNFIDDYKKGQGNNTKISFDEELIFFDGDLKLDEDISGKEDGATIFVVDGDLTLSNQGAGGKLENMFFIVNGNFEMDGSPHSEIESYIYAKNFTFSESGNPHSKYKLLLISPNDIDLKNLGQGEGSGQGRDNRPSIEPSELEINYNNLKGGDTGFTWQEM